MPIWKRNLYVLWASQLVTMVGMGLVVPFLPFFVRELGVTEPAGVARWSGLAFSAPFLVAFFATPFWGALGDRYGRKIMVLRALVGLAIAQVLVGLSQNVEQLFFFRMAQGAVSGFLAAALSLVAASTPAAEMGFALGTLHTATAIGQFAGPVFGGILSDIVGYRPIFFIVASVCGLAAVAVFFFVHEARDENVHSAQHSPGFLDNYRFVAREPALRLLLPLVFLTQLPVAVIRPIFALFAESFSLPPDRLGTLTGLAYGVLGFCVAVSAPWWGRRIDRRRSPTALYLPIVGAGTCYALHMTIPSFEWVFPVRALLGLFLGGILPILYSLITSRVPAPRLGGIMGIASSMSILSAVAGPLAGGFLVAHHGYRVAFAFASLLFFAALPLAWRAAHAHAGSAAGAGNGAGPTGGAGTGGESSAGASGTSPTETSALVAT